MVKDICADASVKGNKSNHSLRATGATELYHAGVPEKVIQERTGHLSLTGLRQYEHTSAPSCVASFGSKRKCHLSAAVLNAIEFHYFCACATTSLFCF